MKIILLLTMSMLALSVAQGQLLSRMTNPEFIDQKDASFGCGWIDYNGDQKPDPYFTHIGSVAFFYQNNGGSTFQQISNRLPAIPQTYLSGMSWGDCNNDGLNDLFICSMGTTNYLLKNKGGGNFQRLTNDPAVKDNGFFIQSSFVDYDNDGWLDLFAPTVTNLNFVQSKGVFNNLYKNDGSGNFQKAPQSGLMHDCTNTTCAAFSDYDNDGDQDVFLTEFFRDNHFYENNGDGTFSKIGNTTLTKNDLMSLSCSWGDYDNDGFMDLLVLNGDVVASKRPNYLFHNNGDKTFTQIMAGDLAEYRGCSWSSAWGDLDNDGDLDLYLGTIYEDDIIFMNNGDGTFKRYTDFYRALNTTGVSMADFNNDGFLDVMLALAENVSHTLFKNNKNQNNWINVSLKGTVSNASGIGAKVKVKAILGGRAVWQYRELNGNQGLRGFNDLRLHFGLADAERIDSLIVDWPSKSQSVLTNVKVNEFLSITETLPEKFLRPAFNADTLFGRAILTVQFADKSLADPQFPIKNWSWDFDGDGIEDATEPNPTYTFQNNEGKNYTISLTVSNGDKSQTIVSKDYIQLFPLYNANVARWNKATASTNENTGLHPANAIDGDPTSRWASDFNDRQWFKVELDSTYVLGKVKIIWEGAFASEFEVQTSTDNLHWKTVFIEKVGDGGTDLIQFNPDTAKFVRIDLQKRATIYGFSFYELEIYRSDGTIFTSGNRLMLKD